MNLIIELREWLMLILEFVIALYVVKEFYYDREKDEAKKQKKTRTTRKTTEPSGNIVEESTEISEPVQEEKK